jgi:hypothetical protein
MRAIITSTILLLTPLLIQARQEFTKVVDSKNPVTTITAPGFYKGAAWIDFDNDGDVDLFASPNFIFKNDGGGNFTKLQDPFDFTPLQPPGGASWADLNNDGFIDCIISQSPSSVYINNGDGTFKSITAQIPGLSNYASWGCAIGNIGADAYPDLVFAHATGFHKGQAMPGKVYTNDSQALSFKPITGLMLTDSLRPYTVPYWSDYDMDGDMDLFVASGPGGKPGPDFCYKNMRIETGKLELKPITSTTFAYTPQDGQCYNFIDIDNDRDLDLCLTNYGGAATQLYRNTKGNYMTDQTPFTGKARNLSNNWGDFDNDGDLDVIVTSDGARTKYYKNNGAGVFADAVELGKTGGAGVSNGDYDNDGDLDVFIHGIDSAVALLNNTVKNGNHWVNIKCVGVASGSSALGTLVTVQTKIGGKVVWQTREINAQNSFLSQNDLRVHVGLGDAKVIDAITIKYANGKAQTFKNVKPDMFYRHDEGARGLTVIK